VQARQRRHITAAVADDTAVRSADMQRLSIAKARGADRSP